MPQLQGSQGDRPDALLLQLDVIAVSLSFLQGLSLEKLGLRLTGWQRKWEWSKTLLSGQAGPCPHVPMSTITHPVLHLG